MKARVLTAQLRRNLQQTLQHALQAGYFHKRRSVAITSIPAIGPIYCNRLADLICRVWAPTVRAPWYGMFAWVALPGHTDPGCLGDAMVMLQLSAWLRHPQLRRP